MALQPSQVSRPAGQAGPSTFDVSWLDALPPTLIAVPATLHGGANAGATFTTAASAAGLLTYSSGGQVRHGCCYSFRVVHTSAAALSCARGHPSFLVTLQLTLDQSSVTNLNLGALSALAVFNATLNVTRSTFTGAAPSLCRLYIFMTFLQLLLSVHAAAAGNTIGDGSSVLLVNSSDTTISGSTFDGNSATEFGGAVSVGLGTLIVEDSTCALQLLVLCLQLQVNLVARLAALELSAATSLLLVGRFNGNTAGASGGAISFESVSGSTAVFNNVTFSNNVASEAALPRSLTSLAVLWNSCSLYVRMLSAVLRRLSPSYLCMPAACRGGGASLSSIDSVSLSACTFNNNTVTEWPSSPDAGGACTSQYRFQFTAGDGMFAEAFTTVTVNTSRCVCVLADGISGDGIVVAKAECRSCQYASLH